VINKWRFLWCIRYVLPSFVLLPVSLYYRPSRTYSATIKGPGRSGVWETIPSEQKHCSLGGLRGTVTADRLRGSSPVVDDPVPESTVTTLCAEISMRLTVTVHEAQSTLQPCSPVLNPDSHRHPSKAVNPVTLLAGMQSGDQNRAGEGVLSLKRVPGVVAWFPLFFSQAGGLSSWLRSGCGANARV
jgi:hypothetical protein